MWPPLQTTLNKLQYHYKTWQLGISEKYIRQAFACLVDKFEGDWIELAFEDEFIKFKAWGNEVHIKAAYSKEAAPFFECVIKEGLGGRIYVDEWRQETREVKLELGSLHTTNWWESYRSGVHVSGIKFIKYLKILYGDGSYNKG